MPWITEYTPELGSNLCKVLARGNFREMACAQVGISTQTLRNWLRRGVEGEEQFAELLLNVENAEAQSEDLLITGIQAAGKQDWRALAWILERLASQRWGYKAQAQVDVQKELNRILEKIQKVLGADDAARVFAALADSEPGALPDELDRGRPRGPSSQREPGVH